MKEEGRCLIADDEETFLFSTAELLRREGYHCDTAGDSASAMELLNRSDYDLLISDIRMPGNDELEFIRELAHIGKGIPVILVTGYPTLVSAIRSIHLHVMAYLVKPVDFGELLGHVKHSMSFSKVKDMLGRTRGRLEDWQKSLEQVEETIIEPGEAPRDTSMQTFLDLSIDNTVDLLSDLRHITQSIQAGEAEDCHQLNCPHAEALKETLQVLERTEGSIKSDELVALRKKLKGLLEG